MFFTERARRSSAYASMRYLGAQECPCRRSQVAVTAKVEPGEQASASGPSTGSGVTADAIEPPGSPGARSGEERAGPVPESGGCLAVVAIHRVRLPRVCNRPIGDVHVVRLPVADANEAGDVAVRVRQPMHFERGLGRAKRRPWTRRQREIDRSAVERACGCSLNRPPRAAGGTNSRPRRYLTFAVESSGAGTSVKPRYRRRGTPCAAASKRRT
jgi:hypothetical protein